MSIDSALFEENERTSSARKPIQISVGGLQCESGGFLPEVHVAYMAFGKANADRSNVILVCHALSGNANCAQWWDRMVGPGKALDTNRYMVVGVNALGGCDGTTGPSSIAADGSPYGSRFPMVSIGDMVETQERLRLALEVPAWLMVCGGSMGGMQAIEWACRFPDQVKGLWATASCRAHSAMQIGFNEAARQAVIRDPKWRNGDYPLDDPPYDGISVARMIGHLSFLSESAFEAKFSRRLQDKDSFDWTWKPEFQIESYLSYQGDKFGRRFDANSLLVLTRAIDYFDRPNLSGAKCKCLFTSFSSDWLYPSWQSVQLQELAQAEGLTSHFVEVELPFGHDAFLLDGELQGQAVRQFLNELSVDGA